MEHNTVYRKPGRFAGWPANYGIWSWDNEIVVGFTVGHHSSDGGFHKCDHTKPFTLMQARSTDGGGTWHVADTPCRTPGGRGFSADEHMEARLHAAQLLSPESSFLGRDGSIDFCRAGFALLCARTGLRQGAVSWFYYSYDRCCTWNGPYRIPSFDLPGIAARTDYLVGNRTTCTLFLTAAKTNGEEGRVFCARTEDGGKSFHFLSWIGPEPAGYAIMPASAAISENRYLAAVRCHEKGEYWIDLYATDDKGENWEYLNRPAVRTSGNPPTLTNLADGRLCMTYGYRNVPYGIRAKLSEDKGLTWGEEIILRQDGGDPDLGYPRTVQRPDGKMVTVYYFTDQQYSERYIACTTWKP